METICHSENLHNHNAKTLFWGWGVAHLVVFSNIHEALGSIPHVHTNQVCACKPSTQKV